MNTYVVQYEILVETRNYPAGTLKANASLHSEISRLYILIPFHKKSDTNTDPVETRYIASGTKFMCIVINVKWYEISRLYILKFRVSTYFKP